MELEDQYRSKVRRAAGVMLAWCTLILAAVSGLEQMQHKAAILAGIAVGAGIVAMLVARRVMRLPCPACGSNLHAPVRAAVRHRSRLPECPECGHLFN